MQVPIEEAFAAKPPEAAEPPRYEWVAIGFLALTPLVGIVGTTLYTLRVGFHPWMLALCLGMHLLIGLSICAGYHRFFSHKTYEVARPVQVFYGIFGAMAAQNSILNWSSGHRRHHQYVDNDWDPYNIKRGFWWAHILWIFHHRPTDYSNVPDLQRNPVVAWQDRWYHVLLIVGGLGVPTVIGALYGDWLAGLLWGGFLRVVITHHSTFFVNSLAHSWGNRNYDPEVSACDNWAVALLTLGEGYHSFHHRFPGDYRNGIRWYHWDPAKWLIAALRMVGLAHTLRRIPAERIERAQMTSAVAVFQKRRESAPAAIAVEVEKRLETARAALERALALRKHEQRARAAGRPWRMRAARRLVRRELSTARRQWRTAVRVLAAVPQLS